MKNSEKKFARCVEFFLLKTTPLGEQAGKALYPGDGVNGAAAGHLIPRIRYR